jgi:hypothetical protein
VAFPGAAAEPARHPSAREFPEPGWPPRPGPVPLAAARLLGVDVDAEKVPAIIIPDSAI